MASKFTRNLQIGYGSSILVLMLVGFFTYRIVNNLLASNREVEHSNEVIQRFDRLMSLMKDAETGQRGFLLTGQERFLEPYHGAYNEAIIQVKQLRALTSKNPAQQKNVAAVNEILAQRLTILQALINKKQRGQAITNADMDTGKAAMDTLRNAVNNAGLIEQQLLNEHKAALNRYTGLTPIVITVGILLSIIIAAYSYINVMRDIREKEELRVHLEEKEQETAAFNEELTAANEEITAANEELTAINEELLQAREELAAANNLLEQRVTERTRALTESEEETQALNEELTAINEELAAANEELVTTNEELHANEQQLLELVEELRKADERSAKLAAIVESSDDAIIGKTLDGIITSWNSGAERTFGFTEDEMIGHSTLRLIPPERHDEEPMIIDKLSNGERLDHFETKRLTKDGRIIDVSLTISPIFDKKGAIIGVSKIARDISEQKRDEQRKNDFIGMASHELKTPLTSLTALIQVLQQKLRDTDDGFAVSALAKANLQAKKMTALINGFLNVSRLESGKLLIEKQEFEITDLINETIDEARLSVSGHTLLFNPEATVTAFADREKIGVVISNLISNAVKYSPKGKTITITCSVDDKMISVGVHDEGIGINPQDMNKLFDRYYRVNSEYTRHISGFGVGLYLSAEIIQQHGGRIWAVSTQGAGSTFYFTLPFAGNNQLH